ncbi:DUF456 domain-containing protein [Candidatus Woesearchaeota archaeon]|jgi:hypothetical protein|nr:DUF456 domain-containing protein [Candidatus Woesearchaeota archaeon]MBT6518621.1 DUF456 domain-containing protein [Candidatus Woesearchaeota archaeon]MBT7368054.1 DUF456 domain-containing protein [Candidatus Woesearchaeota archaeon]
MSLEEVTQLKSLLYTGASKLTKDDLALKTKEGWTVYNSLKHIIDNDGYTQTSKGMYLRENEDGRCALFLEKDLSTIDEETPRTGYSYVTFGSKKVADQFVQDYKSLSKNFNWKRFGKRAAIFGGIGLVAGFVFVPAVIVGVTVEAIAAGGMGLAGGAVSYTQEKSKGSENKAKKITEFKSKYQTKWKTGIDAVRAICQK